MKAIRFLPTVARWFSVFLIAGIFCPGAPARAADTAVPTRTGAVLSAHGNKVTLSVGEVDHITPGTVFRVLRNDQEVARLRVVETDLATSRATVISGLAYDQLLYTDRVEMVGSPAPLPAKGIKFPWRIVVGVGILALVGGFTH